MIYLDNGATSFPKPKAVRQAMARALERYANPGRGGYAASMEASRMVYACRELAGKMFDCPVEQVVFTGSCTQGINMALHTLVKPGSHVLISGFEHNAVTRPLHALGAQIRIAGRRLFDWDDTLQNWERSLEKGVDLAVFTHVSNVFGYILPVQQMAYLCRKYGVPFVVDAAQSAGMLPVHLATWGAEFIAMPGHKGLLGPQGTGLLLCGRVPNPLIFGGTGSNSRQQEMPDFLPDRAEAGTLNVPGIAGLLEGMRYVNRVGADNIFSIEEKQAAYCAEGLQEMGFSVFAGPHQSGTISLLAKGDCEEMAADLAGQGIAVRAGLHCAPLAHESAGTLDSGTVRISFGHRANSLQTERLLRACWGLR